MSDTNPVLPPPLSLGTAASNRMWSNHVGLRFLLTGNLLVIVAFFTPWFEVFKLNDPSFPFPPRDYSPWMVLQHGRFDVLGTAVWVFVLVLLGMALGSLVLARSQTLPGRSRIVYITGAMALIVFVMTGFAASEIPFGLSFNWPFLSSTILCGVFLALAGFVTVLLGLLLLVQPRQGPRD